MPLCVVYACVYDLVHISQRLMLVGLPLSLCTFCFVFKLRQGSLNLKLPFCYIDCPASPRNPPVVTLPVLDYRCILPCLAFYLGSEELNSGPYSYIVALYTLRHLSSPSLFKRINISYLFSNTVLDFFRLFCYFTFTKKAPKFAHLTTQFCMTCSVICLPFKYRVPSFRNAIDKICCLLTHFFLGIYQDN